MWPWKRRPDRPKPLTFDELVARNDAVLAAHGLMRTFNLPFPVDTAVPPTSPIQPASPVDAPAPPSALPQEPFVSDLTKFIIDPLEQTLAPAAVPALQDFSAGLTQLLDNLLAKAGTIGEVAAPEVNLTLALASAYGSSLLASKLGTATTPAQIPAA